MSKLDKSVSSVSRISMQIFIEEAWHAGQWTKKKPLGEWDVSPSGYKRDTICGSPINGHGVRLWYMFSPRGGCRFT